MPRPNPSPIHTARNETCMMMLHGVVSATTATRLRLPSELMLHASVGERHYCRDSRTAAVAVDRNYGHIQTGVVPSTAVVAAARRRRRNGEDDCCCSCCCSIFGEQKSPTAQRHGLNFPTWSRRTLMHALQLDELRWYGNTLFVPLFSFRVWTARSCRTMKEIATRVRWRRTTPFNPGPPRIV